MTPTDRIAELEAELDLARQFAMKLAERIAICSEILSNIAERGTPGPASKG